MRATLGHASGTTAALISTLLLGSLPARAQEPSVAWAPVNVGLRVGWDAKASGSLLGTHVRVPVLPSGRVELLASGERTFIRGTHDDQLNLDAVFVTGGPRGGLYAGGGIGWRKGIFTAGTGRQTLMTRSLVVGLRQAGIIGPIGAQAEFRWSFLSDVGFDPQPASIGFNLPLWGWSAIRSARRG